MAAISHSYRTAGASFPHAFYGCAINRGQNYGLFARQPNIGQTFFLYSSLKSSWASYLLRRSWMSMTMAWLVAFSITVSRSPWKC